MTRCGRKVRMRYVAATWVACLLSLTSSLGAFKSSYATLLGSGAEMAALESEAGETYADKADFSDNITVALQSHISDGIRRASAAIQKSPQPLYKEVTVEQGDTITSVLQSEGISNDDSYKIVKALSEHVDPRKIKAGQDVQLNFKAAGPDMQFSKLTVKVDPTKEVTVMRKGLDSFSSKMEEKELLQRSHARTAEIETSLYGSAAQAGIPQQVIAEVIRIYSWDVDFQRDIQPGDKIEVLYDTYETADGDLARYGDVLYANLTVGGKNVPIYRYEMKDGHADFFKPDGRSIRNTLMKTPIDGARISSGFGFRKHPVLGYNKMHKGLDFAAPTGTPIYAAGSGIIDYAGRKSSFGNYVSIRHNGKLKTAYAHMHKFAKGISSGKRVEQGDIIGYVGTTGRSTGPHLHYEVLVNNKQVNPKSANLPTGEQLAGAEMSRFKGLMNVLKQQYEALTDGLKMAAAKEDDKKVVGRKSALHRKS